MGIYTGFGLESMIQLLLEGEVLWMYGLILPAVLAISRFGILWTTYSTAGMMLGSDIRNQGDALVAPSNSSSNLNGFDFLNPIPNLNYKVVNPNGLYSPNYPPNSFLLYSNIYSNNTPPLRNSAVENICANVPGYQRSSIPLSSDGNNLKSNISNTLTIFPNPFETEFRIESSSVSIKEIALFDVLGKSMLTEVGLLEKTHLINLNTAPGCYLLKVVLENGEVTYHKIVKSND